MDRNIVSAVFDNQSEAEQAVRELRARGVPDSALSIIGRSEGKTTARDGSGDVTSEAGGDAIKGALGGAGVGALLGIAALAIPGVGPLAAAGAIAAGAIPEAAAIGAGVGALTGGLTGLLKDHGVSDDDATYYEKRINQGGTFVSVDPSEAGLSAGEAQELLYNAGGHSSSRARAAAL